VSVEPHFPFEILSSAGWTVVVPLPCLQCILDAWATRALTAARRSLTYRVGTTNWALRPVRPTIVVHVEGES
jgi:hypothetical protein